MGAERWVNFTSEEERAKAMDFLSCLGGDTFIRYSHEEEAAEVWVEPLDNAFSSEEEVLQPCFGLQLGYSFGGRQSSDLAMCVIRELARRFSISRIGADSVGWYAESAWLSEDPKGAPARYGAFTSWVEWVRVWKPEWSFEVRSDDSGEALPFAKNLEKFVVDHFADLDRTLKSSSLTSLRISKKP
jgi:hypothetical protein